ncbi:MAG: hypothetical protein COT74_01965 [Bdellovibrionales bacterium CG10_big_fil_rev_8_21_14_0_10_45_34]|nr:MAG: hypothetical protein COT74_01965 [Bdellovibrionales bacterium CG10_big_fil_rev_8_21_14_0_10_45_34]
MTTAEFKTVDSNRIFAAKRFKVRGFMVAGTPKFALLQVSTSIVFNYKSGDEFKTVHSKR